MSGSFVNTILGLEDTAFSSIAFEHVINDVTGQPVEWISEEHACNGGEFLGGGNTEEEVQLSNVGALRLDARHTVSNLRLDSADTAARELSVLQGPALVCDVTTVDEGRDVDALTRTALALRYNMHQIHLCFGASVPDTILDEAAITAALRTELTVGVNPLQEDVARHLPPGVGKRPKAAFITLRPRFLPGADSRELSSEDLTLLRGAAKASEATGAPIVVTLPPALSPETVTARARAAIKVCSGATMLVLRCPTKRPDAMLAAVENDDNCIIVVDGFGRPDEPASRHDGNCGSDDGDILNWLLRIADTERLLSSVGVRHKTHLAAYGGHGYGHAARIIAKKRVLMGSYTLLKALVWAMPLPKPKLDTVKLVCTLCAANFEVKRGHHYSKFDFCYCDKPCLDKHRKKGFDAKIVKGPTASKQGAY